MTTLHELAKLKRMQAAAPDMYRALEAARNRIENISITNHADMDRRNGALAIIDAALKAARGERE